MATTLKDLLRDMAAEIRGIDTSISGREEELAIEDVIEEYTEEISRRIIGVE